MESIPNLEKMHTLPAACRVFDVNALWYFPNRWVVRALYPISVSANQITFLALLMGLAAAGCYAFGGEHALIWGAVFLYGKLFLDNVDGPLARLRGEVSRLGRFLDSFSDFTVAVGVYGAITWRLAQGAPDPAFLWALGAGLRCERLCHSVQRAAEEYPIPGVSVTDDLAPTSQ